MPPASRSGRPLWWWITSWPGSCAASLRTAFGYLNHEQRWITTFGGHRHYHRPLSWYVDLMVRNDLTVIGMYEPQTLPQHLRAEADWTGYEQWFSTIPTMLAIACRPATIADLRLLLPQMCI